MLLIFCLQEINKANGVCNVQMKAFWKYLYSNGVYCFNFAELRSPALANLA